MPYIEGIDKNGPFIKWGRSGTPYHYKAGNKRSKAAAFEKAAAQRQAILATGWKEDAPRSSEVERIKRTLLEMQMAGVKFRRRATYVPKYPRRLEAEYVRTIEAMLAAAMNKAAAIIKTALPEIVAGHVEDTRTDSLASDRIKRAIEDAEAVISGTLRGPLIEQAALVEAERIGALNGREMEKMFKSRIGIGVIAAEPWLAGRFQAWADENVALIKGLATPALREVETTIRNGITQGVLTKDLAKSVTNSLQKGALAPSRLNPVSRGRLIARDQVGKLFGQLSRQRSEQAGIRRFIWRTAGDERVRDSHADLEGEVFTWAEGAIDSQTGERIWPGTAIQCRCTAESVFDEMEAIAAET